MTPQEIEVTVMPDGKVRLHVRGVPGTKCVDLTAQLEEALGVVEAREYTVEYRKREERVRHKVQQ